MIFAVVAAFVLVLGSFTWVLTQQARSGGVTQLTPQPVEGDVRGLPGSRSPGLTVQPGPDSGPARQGPPRNPGPPLTQAPGMARPGDPSALSAPSVGYVGPNVAGTPGQPRGGPPVTAAPPGTMDGPSMLRGPNPAPSGPPLVAAPNAVPNGPPITAQPGAAPGGPPVTAQPGPAAEGPPITATPEQRTPEPRPEPGRDEVVAYLRRLERFEKERVRHEAQLVSIVSSTMLQQALSVWMSGGEGQPQFAAQTVRSFDQIALQYINLMSSFPKFVGRPPVACRDLHASYGTALSVMPRIVMALRRAIVFHDLGSVHLVQQLGSPEMRLKFAEADRQLELVTDRFKLPKWFGLGSSGGSGLFSWFSP